MFDTNPVEELERIIDDLQPKYICIKPYETIEVGDMVKVKTHFSNMHNPVYITKGRHTHCTNLYTLDEHFRKEATV